MTTLIINATLVNEERTFSGALLIEGDRIAEVFEANAPLPKVDNIIDATGCYLLPGVID